MLAVEMLVGSLARQALADEQFLSAWRTLYAKCGYATVFQTPNFACSWYDTYQAQWSPVVVRATSLDGELAGLWLLAHNPVTRTLAHAGAHQAEYHSWLAIPGEEAAFLSSAWSELQRSLAFEVLRFKYLPSVALANVMCKVAGMEKLIRITTRKRPLIRLDAGEVRSSFAKKSNKSRFNRLKKRGSLEFRRLTNPIQLEQVFSDFIACYDFRQEAVNNSAPFREDPLKRKFHSALFAAAAEETHITVTFLNDRPIAALWGMGNDKTLHLGMLAHTPLLAEHSPGKLHIMQVCNYLLGEGKEVLDLTSGGDPWKERFANDYDEVAEVMLYRSVAGLMRADLRDGLARLAKGCLSGVGVKPTHVRACFAALRRARPASLVHRVRNWVGAYREFRVYRSDRVLGDAFDFDARVACNSLADVVSFEPGESWQTRDAFLASALLRLEAGESIYTVTTDNRLASYGWMVRNQTTSHVTEVKQSMELPVGSVTLYDFYTHPDFRGRGLYRALIGHMLREAITDEDVKYVYISALADNLPSRHVIESMNFRYQGSLFWRRRFGAQQSWSSPEFAQSEISDA